MNEKTIKITICEGSKEIVIAEIKCKDNNALCEGLYKLTEEVREYDVQ